MTTEQLERLLRKHKLYLKGYKCGKRLDLSGADLSRANLSGANLQNANLYKANLQNANLYGANLREAELRFTNLKGSNLKGSNLKRADLHFANLQEANLCRAILKDTNLDDADFKDANLSGARGLLSAIDYLEKNFEKTKEGYIVYKIFSLNHNTPNYWKIEKNSIIKENVNTDRTIYGSYGINVGTLKYIKELQNQIASTIYKLLIKYEWLAGVVVPYNTEGNIRCERAMIIDTVKYQK